MAHYGWINRNTSIDILITEDSETKVKQAMALQGRRMQSWAAGCSGVLSLALLAAPACAQAQTSEQAKEPMIEQSRERGGEHKIPFTSDKERPSLEPRQFSAVAHDPQHRQFLLFGGTDGTQRFDDTWLLEPSGWSARTTRIHPAARISSAAAYDSLHNNFVLFGGRVAKAKTAMCDPSEAPEGLSNELFCGDTWVFSDHNWVKRNPGPSPSAREGHAMAFDAARSEVVLFGGTAGGSAAPLNDTWLWDGHHWKRALPAHRPPGRFWHSMAYDPIHRQVVLFGGDSGNGMLNDTWLWTGSDWLRAHRQIGPPEPRTAAAMDYDPATGKMVMFSGTAWSRERNGSIALDTWAWDGSRWKRLADYKFELITDFSKLTIKEAEFSLLANGTPSYLWLPKK